MLFSGKQVKIRYFAVLIDKLTIKITEEERNSTARNDPVIFLLFLRLGQRDGSILEKPYILSSSLVSFYATIIPG